MYYFWNILLELENSIRVFFVNRFFMITQIVGLQMHMG